VAIQRGYRFWVPEARSGLPLNRYEVEVAEFKLSDPDGGEIDLTRELAALIGTPATIPAAEFRNVVDRWISRIHGLLTEDGRADQWLQLEYEDAPESATTGTLWIDRLACIDFVLDLTVRFEQGRRGRSVRTTYDSRGTLVTDLDANTEVFIQAFGGSTSNKCRPKRERVPLCEGVEFAVDIVGEGSPRDEVFLTATPTGGEQPTAFLWEVQDAVPALSAGERVVLTFDPVEPTEKHVRLTAFNEQGCFDVFEKDIDIAKFTG
jgi:hypothetical protein